MSCPTCDHTMAGLNTVGVIRYWHCGRCGTLVSEVKGAQNPDGSLAPPVIEVPKLVERCREYERIMLDIPTLRKGSEFMQHMSGHWRRLGIEEAIYHPIGPMAETEITPKT